MTDIRETAVVFGPQRSLIGVLTEPGRDERAGFACLMLNAGTIHRIGPHRVNVKLARRLAADGVPCLRFDLSGYGDSPGGIDTVHYKVQAVRDLVAAMDHVQQLIGIDRFVVFGICSGATNGYAAGIADPRVVGLSLLDGFMFPSRRTVWSRKWHRLVSIPLNRALRERTMRWLKRRVARRQQGPAVDFDADSLGVTPRSFATGITDMIARGVAIQLLYSATLQRDDSGHSQLGALGNPPFLRSLQYEFMGDVDHTATSLAAQGRLLNAVCTWVNEQVRPRHPITVP